MRKAAQSCIKHRTRIVIFEFSGSLRSLSCPLLILPYRPDGSMQAAYFYMEHSQFHHTRRCIKNREPTISFFGVRSGHSHAGDIPIRGGARCPPREHSRSRLDWEEQSARGPYRVRLKRARLEPLCPLMAVGYDTFLLPESLCYTKYQNRILDAPFRCDVLLLRDTRAILGLRRKEYPPTTPFMLLHGMDASRT